MPPKEVLELIERFKRNREVYTSTHYNETQLRREFVDPFFKALGWDIDNVSGHAEGYKDVIHEDSLKLGGTTKAPDYSFRAGGHLQGASVEAGQSAAEAALHRASLQSVQQAAPFPPFPATFRRPQITFRIVIDYERGP